MKHQVLLFSAVLALATIASQSPAKSGPCDHIRRPFSFADETEEECNAKLIRRQEESERARERMLETLDRLRTDQRRQDEQEARDRREQEQRERFRRDVEHELRQQEDRRQRDASMREIETSRRDTEAHRARDEADSRTAARIRKIEEDLYRARRGW